MSVVYNSPCVHVTDNIPPQMFSFSPDGPTFFLSFPQMYFKGKSFICRIHHYIENIHNCQSWVWKCINYIWNMNIDTAILCWMLEMQRGFISCFIPRLINGAEWEMALSASLFNRTKKLFAFVPQASERALRIQTWVSQRSNLGQLAFKPGSVSVQTWVSQR